MAPAQALGTTGMTMSVQEREYYQQLFSYADKDGRGFVEGGYGATFLGSSGLDWNLLYQIWDLADVSKEGMLTMDRFFVALRLVAHAQAGRPPAAELAMMEPPALPDFKGLRRNREDHSPPPGSVAPSIAGGAPSDISELQPVIMGGDDPMRRIAEPQQSRGRNRSPSPRPMSWIPSQREKRKYAALFKRFDGNVMAWWRVRMPTSSFNAQCLTMSP